MMRRAHLAWWRAIYTGVYETLLAAEQAWWRAIYTGVYEILLAAEQQ